MQNDGGPIAAASLGLFGPRLGGQVRGGAGRRHLAQEACVEKTWAHSVTACAVSCLFLLSKGTDDSP